MVTMLQKALVDHMMMVTLTVLPKIKNFSEFFLLDIHLEWYCLFHLAFASIDLDLYQLD